jgi:hypothetical protein
MKKLLVASVGLVFLFGLAVPAGSEQAGGTGDKKFDSTLERIDIQAKADPEVLIEQLSSRYNISAPDIRQAKETYGLGAADIFMATALAKVTHRPVLSVAEEYDKGQGIGWGVMAKDMGIKPGSRAFHDMKRNADRSLAHLETVAKSKQKHDQEMKKAHERKMKKDSQVKGTGTAR